MRMKTTFLTLTLGTLIAAGGIVGGCSSDTTANPDGGKADATATPPPPPPPPQEAGPGSLYDRLGKKAGIVTALDAIVAEELKDEEIASYFYFQVTPPAPVAGHPSVAQVKSCFANQLANAAGGPEQYPGTPADNLGWQCRGMKDIHDILHIPGTVFDRFVVIAAGVLKKAGVADADIAIIGGVLNGTRAAIVDPARPDGGKFPIPDAGGGG